ncbi:hypothetical protein CDAR_109341 [Caerostris darwini]|uniref:Uncharacterized protein n=1 Tax=Caerostris darwini TaxID=1538125 RepID=A0AAV4TQT5_9ARAC|nr:hypothetical protein CDAR_109341 [Caerostris darwini]
MSYSKNTHYRRYTFWEPAATWGLWSKLPSAGSNTLFSTTPTSTPVRISGGISLPPPLCKPDPIFSFFAQSRPAKKGNRGVAFLEEG